MQCPVCPALRVFASSRETPCTGVSRGYSGAGVTRRRSRRDEPPAQHGRLPAPAGRTGCDLDGVPILQTHDLLLGPDVILEEASRQLQAAVLLQPAGRRHDRRIIGSRAIAVAAEAALGGGTG